MATLFETAARLAPAAEFPSPRGSWRLLERVGEGATAVVWRAQSNSPGGPLAALKIARDESVSARILAREAALLARVGRRWGPELLDAGPGFIATGWIEGTRLEPNQSSGTAVDREALATIVAHAVARGLEELHEAGVHHGDVKPANVLCARSTHAGTRPVRDAADERGATLIDLGLAVERAGDALGGTPRYAAPELRDRTEGGPAADLWALGLLLAELLDPEVARAPDPSALVRCWERGSLGEPARWVVALLAVAPGARPSAAWVARRAARRLGLRPDEDERGRARVDRVRRAYLSERARDLRPGAVPSPAIGGLARTWVSQALAMATRLAPAASPEPLARIVDPLPAVRRSRWLVSLVGPSAAAWPLGADERNEGALAAHLVELARVREPAAWTLEDVLGHSHDLAPESRFADGPDRISSLVRELARAAPSAEAIALAEDDVAAGRATTTLAIQLAAALARAGETGRAWVALMGVDGAEVDALRAEISRRRGDEREAKRAAERAIAAEDPACRWRGQATLARLAWDALDDDEAERLLGGAHGAAAAEVRALVALRRGAYEVGLRGVEQALLGSL